MTKFAKTGGAVSVAVVLTLMSSAQAQQYGQCEPERVINSLTTAVLRVAPLFIKPKSQPAPQPIAQTEPPPLAITREQWKQSLIEDLNAHNDPLVPGDSLPRPHESGLFVTLWQPYEGGHVGFPVGRWPGHVHAMPNAVCEWLTAAA